MSNTINFAYWISQQAGEAAVVKMCSTSEGGKIDWWRWTTWLAGALIIDHARRRQGWPAIPIPRPAELDEN
jgi:hypothetical protein